MRLIRALVPALLAAAACGARAGEPNEMFLIRATDKSYAQATDAAQACK